MSPACIHKSTKSHNDFTISTILFATKGKLENPTPKLRFLPDPTNRFEFLSFFCHLGGRTSPHFPNGSTNSRLGYFFSVRKFKRVDGGFPQLK